MEYSSLYIEREETLIIDQSNLEQGLLEHMSCNRTRANLIITNL